MDQLGCALITNERRMQGCLPRAARMDNIAARFLNSVDLALHASSGADGKRSDSTSKRCGDSITCHLGGGGGIWPLPLLPEYIRLPGTIREISFVRVANAECRKLYWDGAIHGYKFSEQFGFDALGARMPIKVELRETSLGNN